MLELESTPEGGTWVKGLSNKRIDEVAQVQQALDKVNTYKVYIICSAQTGPQLR